VTQPARTAQTREAAARKPRGAGRPSVPLINRDAVVVAAVEMIDQDGVDNFSIRKLARSLGVTSPTIYHHFGSRDQLLGSVLRHLLRELRQPGPQRTWQDYFLESARAYRQVLVEHPRMAPLLATRPWTEGSHAVIDESIRLLDEGGVPAPLQLLMLRANEILVIGSGMLAGHLDSTIYGEVGEQYGFLRKAIAYDEFDEADTFDVICRAVVTGLTGSVIANSGS
jgi:TetR/AcrR family tetracycline transcriptional repressor